MTLNDLEESIRTLLYANCGQTVRRIDDRVPLDWAMTSSYKLPIVTNQLTMSLFAEVWPQS